MSTLNQVLATLAPSGDAWTIDAPEEWAQGRTLYGGMTAALAHHAAARAYGDLPPLRSAQATFVGPAAGRLAFRPALLRRGRSSAIVAVECDNEDGPAARLTFSYGSARESAVAHDRVAAPQVPTPDQCAALHQTSRPLPGFLARFEFRQAAGGRLISGGEPEFAVWTRLRDGEASDPVTTLLAVADALPCAAMVSFPKPAAISTLSWAIDLHHAPQLGQGWRLLWSSSESAADGYSLQAMRLFDEAGRVIASGRQVVAIFV